jgi:hypothetical protein
VLLPPTTPLGLVPAVPPDAEVGSGVLVPEPLMPSPKLLPLLEQAKDATQPSAAMSETVKAVRVRR